jgi:hypothetical protein
MGLLVCAGTLVVTCGCLARLPSEESRAAVPTEVSAIYRDSGDRYLTEAEEAMGLARKATRDADARVQLSLALERYQSAWERMLLSGDVAGITKVPLAVAGARPGDISGGMVDCLDLFAQMMKRLRSGDVELLRSTEMSALRVELDALAQARPESLEELDRAYSIQRELWELDDRKRDSSHYRRLLELLELAETSPALRTRVPYDWAKTASEALHEH